MKNCWRLAGATLIVLTCWTATAWAETRYISDQLVVSLREQPQNNAPSITYLRTDMPVEVLEQTGDFFKVRTEAGETGYIKPSYLTPKTPKSVIISQLQKDRNRLSSKAEDLKQQVKAATAQSGKSQQELANQLTKIRKQASELQTKLVASQAALTKTSNDYQTLQKEAKNVVAITKQRDQLRTTNQELTTTVANLEKESDSLLISGSIKWFLAGAGVLFFGWMIGKMSSGRRRRNLL